MIFLSVDHSGTELTSLNWRANFKISKVKWSSVHLPLKSFGTDNHARLMISVTDEQKN